MTTENKEHYLLMDSEQLKKEVRAAVTEPAAEEHVFNPTPYAVEANSVVKALRQERSDYTSSHSRRVKVQVFALPAVIIIPGTLAFVLGQPFLSATLFTLILVAVLIYVWLTGKVHQFKDKKYTSQILFADREAKTLLNVRSNAWLRKRYALKIENHINFSAYSDFTIEGVEYTWVEVEDDGWQFFEAEEQIEAPLK